MAESLSRILLILRLHGLDEVTRRSHSVVIYTLGLSQGTGVELRLLSEWIDRLFARVCHIGHLAAEAHTSLHVYLYLV